MEKVKNFENYATMDMGISELHKVLSGDVAPLNKIFYAPVKGKLYVRFSDCGCGNGRYCDAWYPYEAQKGITQEQEITFKENNDIVLWADSPQIMLKLIKKELKFARSL